MKCELYMGSTTQVGDVTLLRLLKVGSWKAQVAIAPACTWCSARGRPHDGYYWFSKGQRWFITWLHLGDDLPLVSGLVLRLNDIDGRGVLLDIESVHPPVVEPRSPPHVSRFPRSLSDDDARSASPIGLCPSH